MEILRNCLLFQGLSDDEVQEILKRISAHRRMWDKQEILFYAGDQITHAGIVLQGELHIFCEDFWGNQTILADLQPGDLFGEVFACLPGCIADVCVRAVQPTEVLYLDIQHLLCIHPQAAHNFIRILAQKNRILNQKIHHLTQRGIRRKLLSYLSEQCTLSGKTKFCIPFNRQQLADYLSVDRTALSAELSRLRKEGILTFHKNQFTLCQTDKN